MLQNVVRTSMHGATCVYVGGGGGSDKHKGGKMPPRRKRLQAELFSVTGQLVYICMMDCDTVRCLVNRYPCLDKTVGRQNN